MSKKEAPITLSQIASSFLASYQKTESRVKLIDAFLLFSIATVWCFIPAVIQCAYAFLAGSFPFNSFLSAFFACVGQFVLFVNLRLYITQPSDFGDISFNRAFLHFVFCSIVLHFVVLSFMG